MPCGMLNSSVGIGGWPTRSKVGIALEQQSVTNVLTTRRTRDSLVTQVVVGKAEET